MKNLKNLFVLLILLLVFNSCSRSESDPTPTPAPDGFSWTENGGTKIMTGYTPFFITQGHSLFVHNATGDVLFEFNFNSLEPATNVLGGTTYNPGAVFYVDYQFAGATSSNRFAPTSGTCIIASNANGKISGTFTASGSAGTISSIKGTFKDITVQP